MEHTEEIREEGYKPRPRWQVWLARLGILAFLLFLALFYFALFGGGV